jgi:hypothetical protein
MTNFEEGDIVRIHHSSIYYIEDAEENPRDVDGVFRKDKGKSECELIVEWPGNIINTYSNDDLYLVRKNKGDSYRKVIKPISEVPYGAVVVHEDELYFVQDKRYIALLSPKDGQFSTAITLEKSHLVIHIEGLTYRDVYDSLKEVLNVVDTP